MFLKHCPVIVVFTILFALAGYTPVVAAAEPASPNIETMAGQMLLVGFRGTGEAPLEDLELLLEDIRQGKAGGVIYFDRDFITEAPVRNIVTIAQVKELSDLLQKNAPIPLFISVDQEGGKVQRLKSRHGAMPSPSAAELGEFAPEASFIFARNMGSTLRQAGINLNFAPCVDVNSNPESPAIGAIGRSFGPDPQKVAAHARAFAKGLWDQGVIPAYKHFPGHGSATADTHLGLTDITETWQKEELVPYKDLRDSPTPAMVMVGHLRNKNIDPLLPASLSHAFINGLLRQDMGWQGVVVTDDLQMKAITDSYKLAEIIELTVNAGTDIILLGNNLEHNPGLCREAHATLISLVKEGKISEERIRESYERIMALKALLR